MRSRALASRYAKSIYETAVESKSVDRVFSELRGLVEAFAKETQITEFLSSPVVDAEDRERMLVAALKNANASNEVHQLLLLLARNGRFSIFSEIVDSYQEQIDADHGVARGTVRSAVALGSDERQKIESIVEKVLKKKVIMTYRVDPSVIGGLVAQVGSYTFDDSLDSHLRRMNEDLKRRAL